MRIASRRCARKTTISKCSWPMRSRTMPPRSSCSSAILIAAVRERCGAEHEGRRAPVRPLEAGPLHRHPARHRRARQRGFHGAARRAAALAADRHRSLRPLRRQRLPGAARARHRQGRRDLGRERRQARQRACRSCIEDKTLSATVTVGLGLAAARQSRRGRRHHRCGQRHAPRARARRQSDVRGGQGRHRYARAGLRQDLGQAHQERADGEPLPPGAAADREPARRGQGHVRRAGAHARRTGQRGAARGVHRGRGAQRLDEEHRSLGDRRLDVLRRQPQGRLHFRARVEGHRARQEPAAVARHAAEVAEDRAQAPLHAGDRGARESVRAADQGAGREPAQARLPLRARAFRHRPRSAQAARPTST